MTSIKYVPIMSFVMFDKMLLFLKTAKNFTSVIGQDKKGKLLKGHWQQAQVALHARNSVWKIKHTAWLKKVTNNTSEYLVGPPLALIMAVAKC